MSEKPVVVVDTQIFLRAAIRRESLPGRLVMDMRHDYRLATSSEITSEVEDVLNRPLLRAKFRTLTDAVVTEVLAILAEAQQITVAPDQIPQVSRDPKDDVFLATAVEAGAQYLVTEDQDLLVLNPYQGIRILNALDFLNVLRTLSASAPETSAPPQSE